MKKIYCKAETIADILSLDILPQTRLWLVMHREMIEEETVHLWGAWCAEQALLREEAAGRKHDKRSWRAIEATREYASGKLSEKKFDRASGAAQCCMDPRHSPASFAAYEITRLHTTRWGDAAVFAAVSCTVEAAVNSIGRDHYRHPVFDSVWTPYAGFDKWSDGWETWKRAIAENWKTQFDRLVKMLKSQEKKK